MDNIIFGIIIAFILISMILFFCVILIRVYFTKIKKYTQLIYQKDIDFQKSLTATIVETQEQVLNNISQDLHDDAGQQLTFINFQLENLKIDQPEIADQVEPLSQSLGQLSQSIRSISHSLNHQLLLQQDLIKAITNEIERIQNSKRIIINSNIDSNVKKEFSSNEKIVVYRIFQEILNNIFKHAKANSINITITSKPSFGMIISDNGKGFSLDKTEKTLGLQNMHERAKLINYKLAFDTIEGKGTTVSLFEK
jgi:signal transduction histidine kinase